MAVSHFKDVEMGPPIEVFQLTKLFNDSQHPDKVNLGAGAYRTEEGQPWVLPVVRAAESQMANDKTLNHEYLPVSGLPDFRDSAIKLLLGSNHRVITENRVGAYQSIGGTGALRIAAAFLKDILHYDTVYVSAPTWGNHKSIFKRAGFSDIKEYRYWNGDSRELNFNGMLEDLHAAPEKSVVILHGIAHNPTGIDPSKEQWEQIFNVCKERNVFVLMDIAYQGFASGNVDDDGWAVRYFADKDIDMFVSQSFSKNFGLYNERVGCLHVISTDKNKLPDICSQMEWVIRTMYSNPPNHGARIVGTVLNNKAYFEDWKGQIMIMATRIKKMRQELVENLKKLGTPGTWDHITKQIGMFSYTGLNGKQAEYLKSKHIFLLNSGRISCAGLTSKNIVYVAKTIDEAVRTIPKIGVISFAELAKKKLQESLNVISTGVTIDGVIVRSETEDEKRKPPEESDVEDFVKIKIRGSLSDASTPELGTSVDHEAVDPSSLEKVGEMFKENKSTSVSGFPGDDYSVQTLAGTTRSTVKTFSSRGAQTVNGDGQNTQQMLNPRAIPARFQGTMVTPVYFDGLMMTPEKLGKLMKDAMDKSGNLSIPVEFQGGMITAAFKSFAENITLAAASEGVGSDKSRATAGAGETAGKGQVVNVKFEGRLLGVLDPHESQNGLPVIFDGSMTQPNA